MVNTQELERVMIFIEDNPKRHVQDEWICGTGACFAGWVCLLNGWKWFQGKEWSSPDKVYSGRKPQVLDQGHTRVIRDLASELLNLDSDDAVILFWGNNSPQQLRLMVDDLVHEEKLSWHWLPVVARGGVTTMQRLAEKN